MIVAGVSSKIIDDASRIPARQKFLAKRPISPVLAQDRFLFFLRCPLESVWCDQGGFQRGLLLAEYQLVREKRPPMGNRAEALIVEIVRHSGLANLVRDLQ